MRGEEGRIRQVSFSRKTVRYVMGACGVLVLVVLTVGFFSAGGSFHKIRAANLAKENAALAEELVAVREDVADFESTLEDLTESGAQFRLLAGLDTFDTDLYRVGIGGPGFPSPEDNPIWSLDPVKGQQVYALDYDMSALERRARLLSQSLAEATDTMMAHRDLLESTPSILPTQGYVSSGFSSARLHPIHNQARPHEGIDISAPAGTPIMATAKGRVIFSGRRSGYGLVVEVDHGYGYVTRYAHASETVVRRGDRVSRGDMIAKVGQTGIATAPNLHYEVLLAGRPVNPLNFLVGRTIP